MANIAGINFESIVDGEGVRVVVFFSGCNHHCKGCHNPETHDPAGGREVSVEALTAELAGDPLAEGLTLSGGEPFLQAAACAELARAAHGLGLDVWVYSGWTFEQLTARGDPDWDALLRAADVLVDGPFLQDQKSYELHFRGSRNQRLIDLPASLRAGRAVLWREEDPLAKFTVPRS